MKRLRRLLSSQRGDLLLDAMFGSVVIAVIMAAAGSILIAATMASSGNDATTARTILLNTVLSDEKPNLAGYTAEPQTLTRTANGQNVSISLWREDPTPGLTVLHAAMQKPARTSENANCSGTDRFDPLKCLTSSATVTTSSAGIVPRTVPLLPGHDGSLVEFTAPAGATELRFLVKVTGATAPSTLTFGNRDHIGVHHVVQVPAEQSGYFYGRLLVDAGSHLFLQSSGPVTVDLASTLIYEAPTQ